MTQHPAPATVVPGTAQQVAEQEAVAVECYPNQIPAFIERELARLYGSIFSSLEHFRIYGGTEGISTYVARRGGKVVSVILYRVERRRIVALNEFIRLGEREITRFAEAMFAAYPQARGVSFNAVELKLLRLPYPSQRFNCSEDIALALPATPEDYLARLGKSTRKNIKHHLSRLKRHRPSLRFEARDAAAIDAGDVAAIIALNRARMAGKHKTSYLDDAESERLLQLAQSCGMVTVMRIDGRVCAGAICALVNGNYFSYVTAHDPAYDDYRLGTLCCYLTICEAIARGGREFHLLWGRYQYKYMLAGVQRDLDHLDVYRSRLDYLRNGGAVLRNACRSWLRQARFWLLDPKRQEHPMLRAALTWLRQWRRQPQGGA
ncbi:MAG TPA: GNAT family N-acetyltransferase [Noviherbaspirillum sp.]|nr:GNAT family N-acetyltransferase [Noviherbaspirillum sp.]